MSETEQATPQPGLQQAIPAEAIDALVIQLDSAFQMAGPGVPDYVMDDGKKFIASLNRWSEEKRKAQQ
jgi:hypothetical protein